MSCICSRDCDGCLFNNHFNEENRGMLDLLAENNGGISNLRFKLEGFPMRKRITWINQNMMAISGGQVEQKMEHNMVVHNNPSFGLNEGEKAIAVDFDAVVDAADAVFLNGKFCLKSLTIKPELALRVSDKSSVGTLKKLIYNSLKSMDVAIIVDGKEVDELVKMTDLGPVSVTLGKCKEVQESSSLGKRVKGKDSTSSAKKSGPDVGVAKKSGSVVGALSIPLGKGKEVQVIEPIPLAAEPKWSKKWFSADEVEAIVSFIEKNRARDWAGMKQLEIFKNVTHRTPVSLKDKWLNLVKRASFDLVRKSSNEISEEMKERIRAVQLTLKEESGEARH